MQGNANAHEDSVTALKWSQLVPIDIEMVKEDAIVERKKSKFSCSRIYTINERL